ncbi:MAG: sodium-coupled neutral amino acid transporter, partial [Streblomastix strix]
GGIVVSDMKLFSGKFPKSIGVLSMSFFYHNLISKLFANPANPQNNARDLFIAYTIDMLIYAAVGIAGFLGYHIYVKPSTGEKAEICDNYLLVFSSFNVVATIARVFLVLQMCVAYPVLFNGFRTTFLQTFIPKKILSYRIGKKKQDLIQSSQEPDKQVSAQNTHVTEKSRLSQHNSIPGSQSITSLFYSGQGDLDNTNQNGFNGHLDNEDQLNKIEQVQNKLDADEDVDISESEESQSDNQLQKENSQVNKDQGTDKEGLILEQQIQQMQQGQEQQQQQNQQEEKEIVIVEKASISTIFRTASQIPEIKQIDINNDDKIKKGSTKKSSKHKHIKGSKVTVLFSDSLGRFVHSYTYTFYLVHLRCG